MHQYLILQNPGHNHVFYQQSTSMAMAELTLANQTIDTVIQPVNTVTLTGIPYLSFSTRQPLTIDHLQVLSRLSFIFALFEHSSVQQKEKSRQVLIPIHLPTSNYVDTKLSTLMKYSGKTNELFTRMMINVGLLASAFNYEDNIHLLDPVCGRGTTLFESAIYGYDTTGIEIESSSVHKACISFKKYLEREKYKHKLSKHRIHGKGKSNAAMFNRFEYANSLENYKIPHHKKRLTITLGSILEIDSYFRQSSFHLIVGDLPYGIAHHSNGGKLLSSSKDSTRNPCYLLKNSLYGLVSVLKKGGALVLSWNVFVLPKKEIFNIMTKAGLKVCSESPFDCFEHRVDQSIKRDIIVAIKET